VSMGIMPGLPVIRAASSRPWRVLRRKPGFFQSNTPVKEKRIQVVHSHEAIDSCIALPLYLAGVPLVRSRHWMMNPRPDWAKRFFFQHSCNRLIAASKEIFDTFDQKYKVPAKKLALIGEGAHPAPAPEETSRLRERFRATWCIPSDALVFGIIGIIRGEKGHRDFLEAAFRVIAQIPNVYFVIIGEGSKDRTLELYCIDHIRQKARQENNPRIHQQIILTGFYKEIHEPYCGVDIVVIPSISEAQSKVGPEALIHGKAVIASRVGGLPEIIDDGKTGILIPPSNIDSLANAMVDLARDNNKRESIARQGQLYAQNHLRFDQRMEELLSCYESCLKK